MIKNSKLCHALTVEQLIEALQDQNPDSVVVFACDYGDHCHTKQALPVESVEKLYDQIKESGYSQSGLAICEEDSEDFGDQHIVVLT